MIWLRAHFVAELKTRGSILPKIINTTYTMYVECVAWWAGRGGRQKVGAIMVIKATVIKVLFAEMYVNVVFVIRCLYSAVSLTLVKE